MFINVIEHPEELSKYSKYCSPNVKGSWGYANEVKGLFINVRF